MCPGTLTRPPLASPGPGQEASAGSPRPAEASEEGQASIVVTASQHAAVAAHLACVHVRTHRPCHGFSPATPPPPFTSPCGAPLPGTQAVTGPRYGRLPKGSPCAWAGGHGRLRLRLPHSHPPSSPPPSPPADTTRPRAGADRSPVCVRRRGSRHSPARCPLHGALWRDPNLSLRRRVVPRLACSPQISMCDEVRASVACAATRWENGSGGQGVAQMCCLIAALCGSVCGNEAALRGNEEAVHTPSCVVIFRLLSTAASQH